MTSPAVFLSGRGSSRGAFTLFEVILALALTIGVAGALFGFGIRLARTRDVAHAEMEQLLVERGVMDRLTAELRSALSYPFLQLGLEGDLAEATWVSAQWPGPAAWAELDLIDGPVTPESDIQLIGYRIAIGENEEGDEIILGLERTCQKVLDLDFVETTSRIREEAASEDEAVPEDEEDEEDEEEVHVTARLVAKHIQYLAFRYYDGAAWQEQWTGGDLPAAVEITLGDAPWEEDDTEETYQGKLIRRVVYIPAGQKEATGGIREVGGGR